MDLPAVQPGVSNATSNQHRRTSAASAARDSDITAADWWFAELDQRPFPIGDVRWTMQVLGVHLDGFHTWIQIEFAEDPDSSVLLHLTPWAGLHDAIDIVRAEIVARTSCGGAAAVSSRCLGECHNVIVPSAAVPLMR